MKYVAIDEQDYKGFEEYIESLKKKWNGTFRRRNTGNKE